MVFLNLGCGQRFHPDWTNIDFNSAAPQVRAYDLNRGIPLPTACCAVVYHSHLLEHFSKERGAAFIGECFRVLKPGGLLRVVVPDLEALATEYLHALHACRQQPGLLQTANHAWATIELMDQMVRSQSGGDMAAYWRQPHIPNEDTLVKRLGHEFTAWRSAFLQQQAHADTPVQREPATPSFYQRVTLSFRRYWLKRWGISPDALPTVQFQQSGEKHLWMYDAISLQQLLEAQGFTHVQVTDAFHSRMPDWATYRMLDVEAGRTRKPDSLFMEAIKPPAPHDTQVLV